MSLFLITAFSNNFVIGHNNTLPWNYKEDLLYFKNKTDNSICIMGYNTYLSLKKPLRGRINIVINKNIHGVVIMDGFYHISSLEKSINWSKKNYSSKDIFIIGGSKIYEESLKNYLFDKIYVTHIHKDFSFKDSDSNLTIYFPFHLLENNYIINQFYQSIKFPELEYQEWIPKLYYELD